MTMLSEVIILWWLFIIILWWPFNHLVIWPNKYDASKAKGIGAIEAFEYENARNDFVAITEKNEKQYVRLHKTKYFRDPSGIFPCIDGFTDNPAVQCNVQV